MVGLVNVDNKIAVTNNNKKYRKSVCENHSAEKIADQIIMHTQSRFRQLMIARNILSFFVFFFIIYLILSIVFSKLL